MKIFSAWLSVLVAALGLSSCAISTPFSGSTPADLQRDLPQGTPVVVVVTHIVLEDDRATRRRFWAANGRIAEQAKTAPGLLTYALRRQVFGNEGWTFSVWRDAKSVNAFMRSGAHAEAMRTAMDTFVDARFARMKLPVERVPPDWDAALAMLEENARHYYE